MAEANDVSYFGTTNARRKFVPFGIRQADRLSHMYVVGKTGVGKSTMLKVLARQDMAAGRGFALIDPHGDLAEGLWRELSPAQRDRVVYLNAADLAQPYGYNPLRQTHDERIPLAAAGLLETLRKLWPNAWGVRMEHVLRNALFALLERDDAKLPDILSLFDDKNFRQRVTREIRNPVVKGFWKHEFENYPPRLRADAVAPIQNKLGALLADPRLRRIFVDPSIEIRFRALMDEGKCLLVNLSRGSIGEDATQILGGFLASTLSLAAFSRTEVPAAERRPFFFYADEFQNFTTLSFANMMAEIRKYGVGLVLAHQHLNQLEPDVRHAVFGNAGTFISFRVGAEDAARISAELSSRFSTADLGALPNGRMYLRLMIDGEVSAPFSASVLRSAP